MGVQPATQLATKDFIDSAHNTVSGNLLILNVVLKFNTKSLAATNRNKGSTNSVMSSPQSKNYSKKHLWFIEKPEQIGVIFPFILNKTTGGIFPATHIWEVKSRSSRPFVAQVLATDLASPSRASVHPCRQPYLKIVWHRVNWSWIGRYNNP